jgi:CheY-like chemotaxis protein
MANVLIVEDNPDIATLYERIFRQHRTQIINDVPEAITYLRRGRPDLVIMDFHLPSGSGVDVLSYMRSQSDLKDIPVLGVSCDDLLKDEATEQGMNAFLPKPIDIGELLRTAQTLIGVNQGVPAGELKNALNDYAEAYQAVYHRMPRGKWTGSEVLIDGYICDQRWLHSETKRLRSLVNNGDPRSYLHRLLDKIRRM